MPMERRAGKHRRQHRRKEDFAHHRPLGELEDAGDVEIVLRDPPHTPSAVLITIGQMEQIKNGPAGSGLRLLEQQQANSAARPAG